MSGIGDYSLNTSKDVALGVTGLAPICESDPVADANYLAVVDSACSCVFEAGSDREDKSSYVCYVGDTRQSFSVRDDDSILHTHHLSRIVSHRSRIFHKDTLGIIPQAWA